MFSSFNVALVVFFTRKYFEELKLKEEETREKFFEMLDKWKEEERRERPRYVPEISLPLNHYPTKKTNLKNVLIVILVLALIVGFLFFLYNGKILSFSNISQISQPSEPKYVQDCLNKAKEIIELERMRSTIDFTWKILEYKEFSSTSEAEAYAKDRITVWVNNYYTICKRICTTEVGSVCQDVTLSNKILAIIYEERAYYQGSEIKGTGVIYCGDDGRIFDKGLTDTCYR